MIQYSIRVPGDHYRGVDARRQKKTLEYNRVARLIEQFINNQVAQWNDDTVASIMSHQIAQTIGEDGDLVQQIMSRIDGGSNGVTIWKGNYGRAIAARR